ncbi:MAG: hypothetical protein OEZ02_08715 [Anaerolineae bacterium]|nr:hypothetical protein [Anaerolineae bacterium]
MRTTKTALAMMLVICSQACQAQGEAGEGIPEQAAAAAELHVVYEDGGNLWLWTEAGGSVQLNAPGDATNLDLSDDGQVIAYIRSFGMGDYELWAMNNDGSHDRRLLSAEQEAALSTQTDPSNPSRVGQRTWIPGTHKLAFSTHVNNEASGYQENGDLYVLNADTAVLHTVFAPGEAGEAFVFSPDGSKVALVTTTEIWVANADGTDKWLVFSYDAPVPDGPNSFLAQPLWAPNSNYLVAAVPSADPAAEDGSTTIWHIPLDGSGAEALSHFTVNFLSHFIGGFFPGPIWFMYEEVFSISADLTQVAYVQRRGDRACELRIANIDGSEDTRIHQGESCPKFWGWSPDSGHYIFSSSDFPELQVGETGYGFLPIGESRDMFQVDWVDEERFLVNGGRYGEISLRLWDITSKSKTTIVGPDKNPYPYDFAWVGR